VLEGRTSRNAAPMPAAVARSIREVSRRLAHAVAAERLAHTQVQNVGLARADTHDSVTHHAPAYGHHAADVPHPQAIDENPLAPGELVRGALDPGHLRDVVARMGRITASGEVFSSSGAVAISHCAWPSCWYTLRANFRSSHALRLSAGVRSR